MRTVSDIAYNADGRLLDIHLPDGETEAVLLYFHGGGLEKGSRAPQAFMEWLTQNGIAVVSAEYRLYPEAHFPDFIEDAADAAKWVFENAESRFGCQRIYIGGSSAGGYLSMMLCFDTHYLLDRGIFPMSDCGYIHNAGQPTTHYNVLQERGIDRKRIIVDSAAPLYFIGAEAEYPPMLFIVSDNDMKNRYEQTLLAVSTLKHFGHDSGVKLRLMQGKHCAHDNAFDENGESVFGREILTFVRKFS